SQKPFAVREDAIQAAEIIELQKKLIQPLPLLRALQSAIALVQAIDRGLPQRRRHARFAGAIGFFDLSFRRPAEFPRLFDLSNQRRETLQVGEQEAENKLRIGAADGPETSEWFLPKLSAQSAVMREAVFATVQLAREGVRIGVRRRRARSALANVGDID